jgi:Na+-driven multidrug efflux pump
VRKLYRYILFSTIVIGLLFTILFEAAPRAVVGIFGQPTNIEQSPEVYWEFGEKTFRIFLMLVTFTCTIKMTSIFFQAVGKPISAIIASLIRDIVCFIPLITILPLFFGIDGILYAAPCADFIAMVVAGTLTIIYFKNMRKLEKSELDANKLGQECKQN